MSEEEKAIDPAHVTRVRLGHGANCSSIGSVLDLLFATASVGAAIFAAAAAAAATGQREGERDHEGEHEVKGDVDRDHRDRDHRDDDPA